MTQKYLDVKLNSIICFTPVYRCKKPFLSERTRKYAIREIIDTLSRRAERRVGAAWRRKNDDKYRSGVPPSNVIRDALSVCTGARIAPEDKRDYAAARPG